jgi:hypothetical protein
MFFYDPIYLLVLVVTAVVSGAANLWVRATFARFSRVRTRRGLSGADAAREILSAGGVTGVEIEPVGGFLADHYQPVQKRLRLSRNVFGGASVAAVGVAAHEAGHALQHAQHYTPLAFRTALVAPTQIAPMIGVGLMILSLFTRNPLLGAIGLAAFGMTLVFALVTLPVELDATRRAKLALAQSGIVTSEELDGVNRVLTAAAFTYVAAAISSLLLLLYWASRLGFLGGRRD